MKRISRTLLAAALLLSFAGAARADDAAAKPADGAAQEGGCKPDGSCCGAGSCAQENKGAAAGEAKDAHGDCPCKRARAKQAEQAEQAK